MACVRGGGQWRYGVNISCMICSYTTCVTAEWLYGSHGTELGLAPTFDINDQHKSVVMPVGFLRRPKAQNRKVRLTQRVIYAVHQ